MSLNNNTDEGLKRAVGAPGLALAIINGIIGSGIFVLPAIVGMAMGSYGILSYVFCSIMLAAIMLCYAEIGSKVTCSGGSYAYVEAAFGDFPGYLVNWLYFFGWSILGSAAVMNILADSLAVQFPVFENAFIRGILYFILIGLMVLTNITGVKQGIGLVKLITIIKLLPLIGIILLGFPLVKAGNYQWEQVPSIKTFGETAFILFYAFAGFETSLCVGGEIKNPKRNVPLGLFIGGLAVLIIYLLLQTVTQGILGNNMATYKEAPLAAVAEKIAGPIATTVLLFTAAISCFGSVSADVMATPRSLFAASNNGLFPGFLGNVHKRFATPYLAIITYGLLIFIFAVSGGFKQLAILASAAILIIYLSVILSVIRLRYKKQEQPGKTFKAPGGLAVPVFGILAITWLLAQLNRREIISAIVFMVFVCIMYLITIKTKHKKKNNRK